TGLFVQQELELTRQWKVVAGARFDTSAYRQYSLSPRVALLWEPFRATAFKFLYGRSFRNPTAYEPFFTDGITSEANPSLKPEQGNTFEIVAQRRLASSTEMTVSLYQSNLRNLIVSGWNVEGLTQFHNAGADTLRGVEAAISGSLWHRVDAR